MGSTSGAGDQFYGPYEPRVSPDGKRIAYWFGQYSKYFSSGCYCYLWHVESQSTWTWSNRFTDPTTEGDYYKGITQPEWLTNDRVLASYGGFSQNIWTYKVGTGHGYTGNAAQVWFGYQDPNPDEWGVRNYYDFGDPALSPDGRKLALTDGGDANSNTRLWLASVERPRVGRRAARTATTTRATRCPSRPTMKCVKDVGTILNPTWSPDSHRLAFSVADGKRVVGVRRHARADELAARGGAQRVRADDRRRVRRGDGPEQRGDAGRVVGAPCEDAENRQPLHALGEIGEPAQRLAVGPVEVVGEQQQRPLAGEVGREPEEAVEERERLLPALGAVRRGELPGEQGARQGGRAAEQPVALPGRRRGERRLEELAHDAEGEAALELAAARGEHRDAGVPGAPARLLEQPGLADPGRPLDRHERAPALAGPRERVVQAGEIAVPLDQLRLRRGRSHGRCSAPILRRATVAVSACAAR